LIDKNASIYLLYVCAHGTLKQRGNNITVFSYSIFFSAKDDLARVDLKEKLHDTCVIYQINLAITLSGK
jgi:hypothetical protein